MRFLISNMIKVMLFPRSIYNYYAKTTVANVFYRLILNPKNGLFLIAGYDRIMLTESHVFSPLLCNPTIFNLIDRSSNAAFTELV